MSTLATYKKALETNPNDEWSAVVAQALAASGFRDTTRLALSNIEMANDMVEMNSENIFNAVDSFKECLKDLLKEDYKDKAKSIKEFRRNLY